MSERCERCGAGKYGIIWPHATESDCIAHLKSVIAHVQDERDGWSDDSESLQQRLTAAEKERDRLAQRERDMQTAINALCEDAREIEGQLAEAHALLREVMSTGGFADKGWWARAKKECGG